MARHQKVPSRGITTSKGTDASDLWDFQRSSWCESVEDDRRGRTFCLCGAEVERLDNDVFNPDGTLHYKTCTQRSRVGYAKRFGARAAKNARRFRAS